MKKKTVAMKKFLSEPANELFIGELIERQINSFMVSYAISTTKHINVTAAYFNLLSEDQL
jgi:DeoR/GlpR family transcriptional regulator of sugar metabolism